MADYTILPPALNNHKGALTGPISPVSGAVVLNFSTLGWSPELFPVLIMQCDSGATVEVLGLDEATWIAYPGSLTSGTLKILRGRWKALKVTTSAPVYVKGDLDWQAWLVNP